MINATPVIRLGTRGSALARWQTDYVAGLLRKAWPGLQTEISIISTRGDQVLDTPLPLIGGKGVFTAEIEAALRSREIDLAVHSLKDLPTTPTAGLVIGAIPERADAHDVLVSRNSYTLETLPMGAKVGTSSIRRSAQLLHTRPDLNIADIRGNIDTRVRKALDGQYDAIVLAHAGLERLNQLDVVTQTLSFEAMLPAPGQGALAVQCRDEADLLQLLEPINHTLTMTAITVERTFLASLDAGCSLPVAAYAEINGQHLNVRGRVTAPDGSKQIDVSTSRWLSLPDDVSLLEIGKKLAEEAIEQGAKVLLLTGGQV